MYLLDNVQKNIFRKYLKNGGKMYIYKVDSSVSDKVQDIADTEEKEKEKTSNSLTDLYDKLDKIENKFDTTSSVEVPDSLNLTKMTYEDKTDDQIKDEAESSLKSYYESGKQNIEDSTLNEKTNLETNKDTLNKATAKQKESLQSYYDEAKQNTSDEALKRGISRSSIVINNMSAFDQDKIDKYAKLDSELSDSISAIEFQIDGLESEKEKALQSFEIEYASKLTDKISTLKNELSEQKAEVIKYNNEIEETEKNYEKKIAELKQSLENDEWDKSTDILDFISDNGITGLNRYLTDLKTSVLEDYFADLSQDEILNLLNNDSKIKSMFDASTLKKLIETYSK